MLEILKNSLSDKGSPLLIILAVIIMAIGGSYKLLTDDLQKVSNDISDMKAELRDDLNKLHDLDKRITVLEIKIDGN